MRDSKKGWLARAFKDSDRAEAERQLPIWQNDPNIPSDVKPRLKKIKGGWGIFLHRVSKNPGEDFHRNRLDETTEDLRAAKSTHATSSVIDYLSGYSDADKSAAYYSKARGIPNPIQLGAQTRNTEEAEKLGKIMRAKGIPFQIDFKFNKYRFFTSDAKRFIAAVYGSGIAIESSNPSKESIAKWKYVWIDKKGNIRKSSKYHPGAMYVPQRIWEFDPYIRAYLDKVTGGKHG